MPDPIDDAPDSSLAGLTVVVVRPLEQAGPLVSLLQACGARTLVMPLVEVVDQASVAEVEAAIAPLTADDWIVVASAHAARRVAPFAKNSPARLSAVGMTTASLLPHVELVPQVQSADGLLAEFPPAPPGGGRAVVAQAVGGLPTLVDGITTLGWRTIRIDTHISRTVVPTAKEQLDVLHADVVIFTAGSQAAAWVQVFGTTTPAIVATIGPQTARNAEASGLKVDVVAADHSLPGVVRAVQRFIKP